MNVELAIKGEIEVLRLKPGDVIVAHVEKSITREMADSISHQLKERFPDHEILITNGITLSVQRDES